MGWYVNYQLLELLNPQMYVYLEKLNTLICRTKSNRGIFQGPNTQNIAMEIVIGIHLSMRRSVNVASQMVQIQTNRV